MTDTEKDHLSILLDVPLKGKVVVGKTTKTLHDLLTLKPSMVIETNHSISSDVELYINDDVIARGEIVVVGEHYGLRIKQIITPEERMQKLK